MFLSGSLLSFINGKYDFYKSFLYFCLCPMLFILIASVFLKTAILITFYFLLISPISCYYLYQNSTNTRAESIFDGAPDIRKYFCLSVYFLFSLIMFLFVAYGGYLYVARML